MTTDEPTALSLSRSDDFVESPAVRGLADRALSYLRAGYPVHLSGPAGTGKTTLAMHVAAQLGRPVVLIHGDDGFGTADLVGGQHGYRAVKVVDNYIRSVLKQEESVSKTWQDNRLTTACKHGLTLIYNEFNRSRPEANNVLLGVLEEGLLDMPGARGDGYLRVHPEFRAIFTSNPEEYAGVHKTQDALIDRMITLRMGRFDRESEVAITAAKAGLDPGSAARIVDVVRAVRRLPGAHPPTVRACLMIGRLTALQQAHPAADDPRFVQICRDVLGRHADPGDYDGGGDTDGRVDEIVRQVCGVGPRVAPRPAVATLAAAAMA